MTSSSAAANCPHCGAPNTYQLKECMQCNARLPWADALDEAARHGGRNAEPAHDESANQTEAIYREMFACNAVALALWHLDGRILDANDAYLRLLGFTRAEVQAGQVRWDALTPPEYLADTEGAVAAMTMGQPGALVEKEYLLRDGRRIPVVVSAVMLPDYPGCGVATVSDISRRRQIERDLREKEAQYRSIFDAAQDGFVINDAQGIVVEANAAACRMHGYEYDEFIGLHPTQFIHRDYHALFGQFAAAIQNGEHFRCEAIDVRRDGSAFPVEVVGSSFLYRGEPHMLGVISDITQRKRAEENLLRTEERLRLATEAASIGTWDYDLVNGVLTWSDRCKEIFGLPQDAEIDFEKFLRILHPDDIEPTQAVVQRVLDPRGSGEYELEYRVIWPDNTTHWISARGRAFFADTNGERWPVRFAGVAVDITDRKRAVEQERLLSTAGVELASSLDYETTLHRVARLAVPALADLCVVDLLDDDGTLRQISVAHVVPEKEELVRELRRLNPHDPNRTVGVAQVMRSGQPEVRSVVTRDVTKIYIHDARSEEINRELGVTSYMIVPMRARGRTLGTIAFCRAQAGCHYDDDDLKFAFEIADRAAVAVDNAHLFHQAQQARREAESANRSKDEFLATLSHELRTPLNAMLGWSNLLSSGKLGAEEAQRAGEVIERNVRVQAQLISDLFDVSRIITGKLHLETEALELLPVVHAAVDSVEASIGAKSIEMVVTRETQSLRVMGDSLRLQQVLWNLLSNAVRFTPQAGRIEVRLSCESDEVVIGVSDSGQGIEPEFLPFVFERFRQADSSSTRRYGGMGLGLAIVRHLTELHGGSVQAQSEGLGRGATFIVRLPLMREGISDLNTTNKQRENIEITQRLTEHLNLETLRGLQVLLVDDEADTRELIVDVLQRYNATVRAVDSTAACYAVLNDWRPDMLLCDIAMSDEDGCSLIPRLRSLRPEQGADIPAIALTAMTGPEDRRRALSAGFQEHLARPVDAATLVVTIAVLAGRL